MTSTQGSQKSSGLNVELAFLQKRPGLKDLAVMARQMATLINAGLPALRAVRVISEQTTNKILAKALADVAHSIEVGDSMSAALSRQSTVFPPLMIGLIKAGETGGFLDKSLDSIAVTYEKDAQLRGTIKSALSYPVAVLVLAILAVFAMLIWVVPVFDQMFNSLGGQLPLPTQILVWLSPVAVWSAPVFVVLGLLFGNWLRKNRQNAGYRRVRDSVLAKMPVFGSLSGKIAVARFTRNLGNMMQSGVGILQGLTIAAETAGNWKMEQAIARIQEQVRMGNPVALPMRDEKIFPHMVTQMIAVGEDSGTLSQMLEKIADFYDAEIKATTEQLTSLIEPLMIAFIGLVVGGMVVALYLPIFTIFQQIK